MLVAAVATVAVDIVVVVVLVVVVFFFLLVLLVLPFTYPSSWSLGGSSRRPRRNFCETEFVFAPLGPLCSTVVERLILPQIFPLQHRGHKEN